RDVSFVRAGEAGGGATSRRDIGHSFPPVRRAGEIRTPHTLPRSGREGYRSAPRQPALVRRPVLARKWPDPIRASGGTLNEEFQDLETLDRVFPGERDEGGEEDGERRADLEGEAGRQVEGVQIDRDRQQPVGGQTRPDREGRGDEDRPEADA